MADPRCPACGAALEGVVAYPLVVSTCRPCGGIWLSNETATRALRWHNPNLLRTALELATKATAPSRDGQVKRLCATCRAPMLATPMWDERVLIDICAEHGTFFDPGELEKVLNRRVPPPSFSYTSEDELEAFREALRAPVLDDDHARTNQALNVDELDQIMGWIIGTLVDAFHAAKRRW